MSEEKSVFETLSTVDVSEHVDQKGKLNYLSWCWAWSEVKKRYPKAFYTIYENEQGWNYFTDGRTAWVKTGVTIEGLEHIEYLPVMDYRNQSIPVNKITSFDVNKSIQRSITKACARHGLGLYIYAGEDLPEKPEGQQENQQQNQPKQQQRQPQKTPNDSPKRQNDKALEFMSEGACKRFYTQANKFGFNQEKTKEVMSKEFGIISAKELTYEQGEKVLHILQSRRRTA